MCNLKPITDVVSKFLLAICLLQGLMSNLCKAVPVLLYAAYYVLCTIVKSHHHFSV